MLRPRLDVHIMHCDSAKTSYNLDMFRLRFDANIMDCDRKHHGLTTNTNYNQHLFRRRLDSDMSWHYYLWNGLQLFKHNSFLAPVAFCEPDSQHFSRITPVTLLCSLVENHIPRIRQLQFRAIHCNSSAPELMKTRRQMWRCPCTSIQRLHISKNPAPHGRQLAGFQPRAPFDAHGLCKKRLRTVSRPLQKLGRDYSD